MLQPNKASNIFVMENTHSCLKVSIPALDGTQNNLQNGQRIDIKLNQYLIFGRNLSMTFTEREREVYFQQ